MASDSPTDARPQNDRWTEETWDRAYSDAMSWRDWQSCEILIAEREDESWWRAPEGVLHGATVLHKPEPQPIPPPVPSKEPGFGAVADSLCGQFNGIIYDRAWIESHWPNVRMCSFCMRKAARG